MEKTRNKHIIGSRFQLLLDHVYGPYPDHILLEKELKPKPSSDSFLDMHCMTLYAGKIPIGFDKTEYINNPPKDSFVHEDHPDHVPVSFCGTVEIRDLTWLTKQGRSYLERDVRNHDRALFPHNRDNRDVILEQVLNGAKRGQSFKIYMLCQKVTLASYLTHGKARQHELLVYSLSADGLVRRNFSIKSLHAETFVASRTFLARYRLRALLAELGEIDKNETPINLKDPNWVIENYVTHILPRDTEDERRLKLRGGPQASSYADDLLYPKHPRHTPKSQLYSELAEHCDWILANQIAKKASKQGAKQALVYIPSWVEWCRKAYTASIEAKQKGVNWGMSSESVDLRTLKRNSLQSLQHRLAKFGESSNFWQTRLESWIRHSMEYVEDSKKPSLTLRARARQPSPFRSGGYNPDPAFSPGYTSSEWSDPDNADFSVQKGLSKAVAFCSQPPQIPFGSFIWHCPGQFCLKEIDLLDVSPQDTALLPSDLVRVLKTKRWKTLDAPIQRALAIMVSHHYQHEHLALRGLHQVTNANGLQIQPSKAQQRPKRQRKKVHSLEVKDEDSS